MIIVFDNANKRNMLLWLRGFPRNKLSNKLSTFFNLLGLTMKKAKQNKTKMKQRACKLNALKTPEI